MKFNRRSMVKLMGGATAMLGLPGCKSFFEEAKQQAQLEEIAPIAKNIQIKQQEKFSGDDFTKPHSILWDTENYIQRQGGLREEFEEQDLVIIGGGISGLVSAYQLKHHQPVILEQASRLGGNSKGESWDGIDYSIGAAYFMMPEKGNGLDKLLKDLGVYDITQKKVGHDPVVYKSKRYYNFWQGESAPESKGQFQKIYQYFRDLCEEKHGLWYPEIPLIDQSKRDILDELDNISLYDHLEKIAGEKLHPHIVTALEHFCWSSYGASMREISAAAGLNFYAGEVTCETTLVAPGGNSGVTNLILKKLGRVMPRENFRTQSLVFDVRIQNDRVLVSYDDAKGNIQRIRAKKVIMACPKFVVNKILKGIGDKRKEAFSKLSYRAYLVANVLLNSQVKKDFYDLFLIGHGELKSTKNMQSSSNFQKITDVVYGNYTSADNTRSVLTLYRALPYEGGRGEVYSPRSFEKYKKEFEEQIYNEILAHVHKTKEDVVDIRISRWGHALPVAAVGLIKNRVVDELRKPFGEHVYFIEQDNWALPCLETACWEAIHWCPKIDKALSGTA